MISSFAIQGKTISELNTCYYLSQITKFNWGFNTLNGNLDPHAVEERSFMRIFQLPLTENPDEYLSANQIGKSDSST